VRGPREDVGQHDLAVRAHILDVVDPPHDPGRVDEIGDPLGEIPPLLVLALAGPVGLAGGEVGVGEQLVREALGLLERLVLLGRVEADAEDDGVCLCERWGSITEPLALNRSAGGGGLGIPPQHDPLPLEVLEGHGVAVLIGE
jgi:hypothetical protein